MLNKNARYTYLYIVPGLLALSLGATYIFLIVKERTVPDGLGTLLNIIIGYFFGAGAGSISQKADAEVES